MISRKLPFHRTRFNDWNLSSFRQTPESAPCFTVKDAVTRNDNRTLCSTEHLYSPINGFRVRVGFRLGSIFCLVVEKLKLCCIIKSCSRNFCWEINMYWFRYTTLQLPEGITRIFPGPRGRDEALTVFLDALSQRLLILVLNPLLGIFGKNSFITRQH